VALMSPEEEHNHLHDTAVMF